MHFYNQFQGGSPVVLSLRCTWSSPGEFKILMAKPHPGKSDSLGLGLGPRHSSFSDSDVQPGLILELEDH